MENKKNDLIIAGNGGMYLNNLLCKSSNPGESIRSFQESHGLTKSKLQSSNSSPCLNLLSLLCPNTNDIYKTLLTKLKDKLLEKTDLLNENELQKLLDSTFPFILVRELKEISIAILNKQNTTSLNILKEISSNSKLMKEMSPQVKRRIYLQDRTLFRIALNEIIKKYMEENLKLVNINSIKKNEINNKLKTSNKRKKSCALREIHEIIGDSYDLYMACSEIIKKKVYTERKKRKITALKEFKKDTFNINDNIEKTESKNINSNVDADNKSIDVDLSFLGSFRSDLGNIQRDFVTPLLKSDPIYKIIWHFDNIINNNNHVLDNKQIADLFSFLKKLKMKDLDLSTLDNEVKKPPKNMQIENDANIQITLLEILEKLRKVDPFKIFALPVPSKVENYLNIIKEPMDFSKMNEKTTKNMYNSETPALVESIKEMQKDFILMIENCFLFNHSSTIFHKEAKKTLKKGTIVFDSYLNPKINNKNDQNKTNIESAASKKNSLTIKKDIQTAKKKRENIVKPVYMMSEGLYDKCIVDVGIILLNPKINDLIIKTLIENLNKIILEKQLFYDNEIIRGLLQLLHLSDAVHLSDMIKKEEYIIRDACPTISRVFLPLFTRLILLINSTTTTSTIIESLFAEKIWIDILKYSNISVKIMHYYIGKCMDKKKKITTDVYNTLSNIIKNL